jgi:hypothetical protein
MPFSCFLNYAKISIIIVTIQSRKMKGEEKGAGERKEGREGKRKGRREGRNHNSDLREIE